MDKIKKNLKQQSIQKQIQFTVILISAVSTLVLGIGSFLIFRYTIEKNYKEDFRYNLEISNNIMDIQLDNIITLSRGLLTNQNVMEVLGESQRQDGKYFNSEQTHRLEQALSGIMYQDEYMAEAAVIDNTGKVYASHKNTGATSHYNTENILKEDWVEKAEEKNGKEVFFTRNVLDDEKSQVTFSLVKQLRTVGDGEGVGYLVINLRKKMLNNSFVSLKGSYDSNCFFVMGDDRNIGYYTGEEESKKKILKEYDTDNVGGGSYIFAETHNELLNWDFVSVVKKSELAGESNLIGIVIMVMVLVVSVLGTLFSKMISNWIYRPLYQLSEMIGQVGEGQRNLTQEFDESEVGKIGGQFKEMVNNNLELRENLLVSQVKERESELMLLQSQINPHFLYNTLDSIACMAIIEQKDQIAKMTECLSRMFRISLSKGNKLVQVKEEMEHISAYMEIQNFRFNNRFELILDIPEEMQQFYVLKFILQPFVENAMYHGLEPQIGPGWIKVWGEQKEEFLYLYVQDNGMGMEDVSKAYQGYGVKNVDERIKLYYGGQCGITFESRPLEGTKVTIKIKVSYERKDVGENV